MIMIYTCTCYGKWETTLDLIDLLKNLKICHCTFIFDTCTGVCMQSMQYNLYIKISVDLVLCQGWYASTLG